MILGTVVLPNVNGLVADSVTHNWCIKDNNGVAAAQPQLVSDALQKFYNVATPTGGSQAAGYISSVIDRNTDACTVKLYNVLPSQLGGEPHGSPILVDPFTLAAAGSGANYPNEVAMVIRLEAVGRSSAPVEAGDGSDPGFEVDRPKQRHTGRIYFGPLKSSSGPVSGEPRPQTNVRTTLLEATLRLDDDLRALGPQVSLGIWSRKDALVRELFSASIDDAFDTQRRRGVKATLVQRQFA